MIVGIFVGWWGTHGVEVFDGMRSFVGRWELRLEFSLRYNFTSETTNDMYICILKSITCPFSI